MLVNFPKSKVNLNNESYHSPIVFLAGTCILPVPVNRGILTSLTSFHVIPCSLSFLWNFMQVSAAKRGSQHNSVISDGQIITKFDNGANARPY